MHLQKSVCKGCDEISYEFTSSTLLDATAKLQQRSFRNQEVCWCRQFLPYTTKHSQTYDYIHAPCVTFFFQLNFHHRQQTQFHDARPTQDASCSQLSLYPREWAHVRTTVSFQLGCQWHTLRSSPDTTTTSLSTHIKGPHQPRGETTFTLPSTVTDVSTCRNQNLAPIEWLCGGWPGLLCPSCSDPFRGVLPWAPRACSKRVLLAVQSSCVVVFTIDSLRFADATSRMEPDLTRSPPDSRSISYPVINAGSRAAAQQNPLSLSATATGCRSSYASHRSVDGWIIITHTSYAIPAYAALAEHFRWIDRGV